MRNKKKKKKCPDAVDIAFAALGIGIVMVCIFPSRWMVAITALALVVAGIMLIKR